MRSIRLLAATTVIALFAAACGDDGGVEPNSDPVASFTGGPCTVGTACAFTDTSVDPDGNITTRVWNFGDGTAVETNPGLTPSHTFGVAGTYNVMLTVTDNNGATNSVTHPVVVNGGTTNVPPAASFTAPACTVNVPCLFSDGPSTDSDGEVTAWSWDFGDGSLPVPEQNPTHTYATAGAYQVTLTVTDDDGATNSITQPVTVSPPAATQCTASGTIVDCALDITARSSLTVTLTSVSCELGGNKVTWGTAAPYSTTVFFNVCSQPTGAQRTLTDATGAEAIFEAGTRVVLRFTRGTPDPTDPPAGTPAANMEGGHPTWTISIDDGGNTGGAGEPDFADALLSVQATAR